MHANANKPTDPSEHWCLAQGGETTGARRTRSWRKSESFSTPFFLMLGACVWGRGGETRTWDGNGGRKQLPLPRPFPVHNKLSHRSGDNYLSHIIKHLEQIGGSNYRLPPGYPSPSIVLPPYITWWDLLCCAFFPRNSFCPPRMARGDTLTKGAWWPDALPQSRLSSSPPGPFYVTRRRATLREPRWTCRALANATNFSWVPHTHTHKKRASSFFFKSKTASAQKWPYIPYAVTWGLPRQTPAVSIASLHAFP